MVISQIVATCLGIALIIPAIILRTGKITQFLALFFAGVYFTLVGLFPTQTHKLNIFNLFQVTTEASAQTHAIRAPVTVDPDTGIVSSSNQAVVNSQSSDFIESVNRPSPLNVSNTGTVEEVYIYIKNNISKNYIKEAKDKFDSVIKTRYSDTSYYHYLNGWFLQYNDKLEFYGMGFEPHIDEAISSFEKVAYNKDFPLAHRALNNMAELLLQKFAYGKNKKDLENALNYCLRSISEEKEPNTYHTLYKIYNTKKENSKALHAINQAIDLAPTLKKRADYKRNKDELVSKLVKEA